jgi:hypothetical protein
MADKKNDSHNRLVRNFHKTFIPERQYLHAMLRFAARNGSGDIQTIAAETGIPTGTSSGKVAPTIDYCRGMGLIHVPELRSSLKTPELTPFGRVVLLEDPFLKEQLTQWIAHLHLCNFHSGADIWYQTFYSGKTRLGMEFTRDTLEDWLASSCNSSRGGLIGPLVRMYEDEASFKICGVLNEKDGKISRKIAPVKETLAWGYGAWLISLMESIAPIGSQITLTELEEKCGWRTIAGWNLMEAQRILELVERKGLLMVDRHMNPWILKAKETATSSWCKIFNDLI